MKITENRLKEFINENFFKHISNEISASKEPLFYHYTNVEALYNGIIVHTPELNKEICLRASNCEYMNDPQEIIAGRSFVDKLFHLNLTRKENQDLENMIKGIFYLISFTSKKDFLPMWSMYGKNGTGITLGFDRKLIMQAYKDQFYKCIYTDKETLSKYKSKLNEANQLTIPTSKDEATQAIIEFSTGAIIEGLYQLAAGFYLIFLSKDPAYAYEQEIRFMELCNDESKIKYRHSNNLLIPYIDIFFPKLALKEICIGPMLDAKRVEKSIENFLLANGFDKNDVKIRKSKVPYRG